MAVSVQHNCKIKLSDGILELDKQEFEVNNDCFENKFDRNIFDKTTINSITDVQCQLKSLIAKAIENNPKRDINDVKHEIVLKSNPTHKIFATQYHCLSRTKQDNF